MSLVRNLGLRPFVRTTLSGVALISCLLAAGCTSAPEPVPAAPSASASTSAAAPSPSASSPTAPSPTASSSASNTPTPDSGPADLVIDITIAGGKVNPNGKKISAKVGQQVTLRVTSDEADEIHAHIGGDGYELEVPTGKPTTGSFKLTSPGSFEVESHHLEKIIVILNAS